MPAISTLALSCGQGSEGKQCAIDDAGTSVHDGVVVRGGGRDGHRIE